MITLRRRDREVSYPETATSTIEILKNAGFEIVEPEPIQVPTPPEDPVTFEDLEMSPKVKEALVSVGIDTIEELHGATDEELLAIDGIGPKALKVIRSL